ncbi:class I SAM-dependent methyltransferase [Starkeya koreensis]|uniref:Class I SAM-dependent methyltransferase n=1 Tax=Ancylobacter koreensis TaxID=266121 RepID=A0ABT0DMY8_9HYPH|nr:methyltransferase domain-containing protein [Ancylobacter koreensis]MCK0208569.1 class I SAM-dependent methyltransferase [Ancylobacter koreensis]
MHDTAYEHGRLFFDLYWRPEFRQVVELGSQNVNGTLRDHCPPGANYLGLDMAPGAGVDLVVDPARPLPLADASADVIVTSSAFEHDACFWQTFVELARILKPGGFLYVNAPSNHHFHRYPVDCWRFYPDAGHALALWSRRSGISVEVVESFIGKPGPTGWADFVAVFRRASTEPLRRKDRMARLVPALNVYDIEAPDALEARSSATWDGRRAAELESRLARAEEELAAVRAARADAETRLEATGQELAFATARLARIENAGFTRRLKALLPGRDAAGRRR